MTYQPPPRKVPLLFRQASWSGGLPVAALVAIALLAVPAIYGARLVLVEIDAFIHGEP